MAAKIVVGLATYLQDFDNLQGGLRTNPYTQYATDLDTSFTTLRTTINLMIDELAAVQGPNAGLGVDLLVFNDPERLSSGEPNDAAGANLSGFVGIASGEVAVTGGGSNEITIDAGTYLVGGTAVRSTTGATIVGTGGAGTRYVSIDLNGAYYVSATAGAHSMDLWSITWNGTAYTGGFTRRQQVFFDGDEYEAMRARPAAGTSPITLPALRFETFHDRLEAIERLLAGFATDNKGNALGQPALRAGTQGAPGLAFESDPNTGIYQAAADQCAITTGGAVRLTCTSTTITATVSFHGFAGSLGDPTYGFSGDANTGMFSDVADTLKFATNGVLAGQFDPQGNLDLPTNARVQGVAPSQSIADNTATLVDFSSADTFDQGNGTDTWHNHASGTLATRQEFTVPTGCDGTYMISVFWQWASPTNATQITIEVTINGTAQAEVVQDRITATTARAGSLSMVKVLAATNVLRVRVTQDDTGGASALNLTACTFSIVKIA